MLPPEGPDGLVTNTLGTDVDVQTFVKQPGRPVPQEVWLRATIVKEDPYGIDLEYEDGSRETIRKAEKRLRKHVEPR